MSTIKINPRNPVEQVIARDRAFFLTNTRLGQFKRRYVPGECPSGDYAPNGKPFAWTTIYRVSIHADSRIRIFETNDSDDDGPLHIVADGDNAHALARASAILQQASAKTRGTLREVQA